MNTNLYNEKALLNPVSTHGELAAMMVSVCRSDYHECEVACVVDEKPDRPVDEEQNPHIERSISYNIDITDCSRKIHLHGTVRINSEGDVENALGKFDVMINMLTKARDALAKGIEQLEDEQQAVIKTCLTPTSNP